MSDPLIAFLTLLGGAIGFYLLGEWLETMRKSNTRWKRYVAYTIYSIMLVMGVVGFYQIAMLFSVPGMGAMNITG